MIPSHDVRLWDHAPDNTRPEACPRPCLHPRFIWIAFAGVSLLSTRYLLVETNFHYPTLVFLAQIFVVTAVVVFQTPWWSMRDTWKHGRLRRRGMSRGTLMAFGAMFFTALSMFCMLQAVLHFSNLPTLVMLVTIAVFADELLHMLFAYTPHSPVELLRTSLLLLACVGILTTEYRLSVPGLVSAIATMLFTGIANALSKFAMQSHALELPGRTEQMQCLVAAGYVVAATWVLLFWPNEKKIAFKPIHMLLLMVSCTATTVALLVGKSTLLPTSEDLVGEELSCVDTDSSTHDGWTLLALTGITGCYSTLSVRRSYTSWYQLCCFALAVACIAHKAIQDTTSSLLHRYRRHRVTFALLKNFPSTTIEHEESGVTTGSVKAVRVYDSRLDSWISTLRSLCPGVVLLLLWSLYLWLNFSTLEYARPSVLDRRYRPITPLEVVISMYKEPVENVRHLISGIKTAPVTSDPYVTIYIKDHEANTEEVQLRTGADKVIMRPNVGREGETYLNHINDRWDSLATHTIFLQADIHNPREFYTRLQSYFDPTQTGFLSLGWSDVCSCEECSDRFSWSDNAGLFPFYHTKIYNSTECNDALLSYKGQFVVSAARIRGISKMIYKDLWHDFVDENSWAHKPEFLRGRPDSMSAPDFGYTMERMWSLLFQCSDMNIAWRCPTLLSGWRLGGDIEDCQCFDYRSLE